MDAPADVREETPVIVTFLEAGAIDLRTWSIDKAHAAKLRVRMSAFAEDWDSPAMDIYEDYNAAKSSL